MFSVKKNEEYELVEFDGVSDLCPHTDPDIIPAAGISQIDTMTWFGRAEDHHAGGRHGCALAILKVIGARATILPQDYTELRGKVHRSIGKS